MSEARTHEIVINRNGTTSLRALASGEVMHSSIGPREEATLLYVEQSRLKERLLLSTESGVARPLVLFDVGLGAGTNALAALTAYREVIERQPHGVDRSYIIESGKACRPFHLVSFENDVTGIELAFEHRDQFPFFEGFEDAIRALLAHGFWQGTGVLSGLSWELRVGDFREQVSGAPHPELVFFDFYSPKAAPELWGVEVFELLNKASTGGAMSASNMNDGALTSEMARALSGTLLFTYSAATSVRVALLLAGFYVGYGRATGAKTDTTVAATRRELLERPLDARWLERLRKSHLPCPHGWGVERIPEIIARIEAHAQFVSVPA